MFTLTKSVYIDFAHHVHGHPGACINLHGHTWEFIIAVGANKLRDDGFVMDFKQLKKMVLEPVHQLLDHSLAISQETYLKVASPLREIGNTFLATRNDNHDQPLPLGWEYRHCTPEYGQDPPLNGAYNPSSFPIKLAVFPFSPTSERLAVWFYDVARQVLGPGDGLWVEEATVVETIHPVRSFASYRTRR